MKQKKNIIKKLTAMAVAVFFALKTPNDRRCI